MFKCPTFALETVLGFLMMIQACNSSMTKYLGQRAPKWVLKHDEKRPCSMMLFGIPCGQKEKLTNRLKRILTGYPCEKEILKELLQNADDAQATEICFIKDPRQHPHKRVFEDSWQLLQGPALCVYNNKPFTKADIDGIQNLGEGSKGDDPNKTGQYGVGFNAVYHLTDATLVHFKRRRYWRGFVGI
ncbi:hypothetical protein OS493_010868 [Desmophyllum pertusum]|uniref:Sacsin/Nov domain-containing protein n=1 Tax=Desmophyllum pertusum TaxID=174260 RepID=A0A9X0CY13_9CNID|nr:hypothetical protein OS493_010868 [Desmophyllum pertusum]